MATLHTPGPWHYRPSHRTQAETMPGNVDHFVTGDNDLILCRMENGRKEANARLIASSPSLYSACLMALKYLENPAEEGQWTREEVLASLHRGLAQATGLI